MKILLILLLSIVYTVYSQATDTDEIKIDLVDVNGVAVDRDIPLQEIEYLEYNDNETLNLALIIEEMRRMASVGIGKDIVPALDPFNLGNISPLKLDENVSVTLRDVMLKGLQGFKLEFLPVFDVPANPPYKLALFVLKVPPLNAEGEIIIFCNDGVFQAHLKIETGNQLIAGGLWVGSKYGPNPLSYQIVGIEDIHHFDSIKICLSHIHPINKSSNSFKKGDLFKRLGDLIVQITAQEVRKALNKVLNLETADQLDALLSGKVITPPTM